MVNGISLGEVYFKVGPVALLLKDPGTPRRAKLAGGYYAIRPTLRGQGRKGWQRLLAEWSTDRRLMSKRLRAQAETSSAPLALRVLSSLLLDLVDNHYEFRVIKNELQARPSSYSKYRGREAEHRELQRSVLLRERNLKLQDPVNQKLIQHFCAGPDPLIRKFLGQPARLTSPAGKPEKIRPYLQQVSPGKLDEKTGEDLFQLWKLLRLTWSSPYNATPGRSLQFLVRDSGAAHHPVIGILGLASPVIQLTVRDNWLGWTLPAIKEWLGREVTYGPHVGQREKEADALLKRLTKTVDTAIGEIYQDDLEIAGLDRKAKLARLRKLSERPAVAGPRLRHEPTMYLEWCRTPFIRRKRAKTLLQLLQAQSALSQGVGKGTAGLTQLMANLVGRRAVGRALAELKRRGLNAHVMDITACGAIAPYNRLLGGKLVTLMAAHPHIRSTFKKHYDHEDSIIASVMAGRPIRRKTVLLALVTTSLYESHSSQYERLQLVGPKASVRLEPLGKTKGYTSIHVSRTTRLLMEELLRSRNKPVPANSFGAGVNPRMRLVAAGMNQLGLTPELLAAEERRLVFGLPLAVNGRQVLLFDEKAPEWIVPEGGEDCLRQYWLDRWLLPRWSRLNAVEDPVDHVRSSLGFESSRPSASRPEEHRSSH